MFEEQSTRRELLKKAAYVTPVILTLAAVPAFAQSGSAPVSESPPVLESPVVRGHGHPVIPQL